MTFTGDCARFCEDDVPIGRLDGKIFHAGYVLILDALDQPDEECCTKMARLLKHVQEQGILTSVDMVTSAERERMRLVIPAIRYTDILCLNEHEGEIAADIPLRDEQENLIYANIPKAVSYTHLMRSILKITGLVPSEQQAIMVFSAFIQPFIIEPPCKPVLI